MKSLLLFFFAVTSVVTVFSQQKDDPSDRNSLRQKLEVQVHYVDSLRHIAADIYRDYENDSTNLSNAKKELQIIKTGNAPDKKAKADNLNKMIFALNGNLKEVQKHLDAVLVKLERGIGELDVLNEKLEAGLKKQP